MRVVVALRERLGRKKCSSPVLVILENQKAVLCTILPERGIS